MVAAKAVCSMAAEISTPKQRAAKIGPRYVNQVSRRAAADLQHGAARSGTRQIADQCAAAYKVVPAALAS